MVRLWASAAAATPPFTCCFLERDRVVLSIDDLRYDMLTAVLPLIVFCLGSLTLG
jgi:hypothetical protein